MFITYEIFFLEISAFRMPQSGQGIRQKKKLRRIKGGGNFEHAQVTKEAIERYHDVVTMLPYHDMSIDYSTC